jgi:hypothetical protein
VGQGRPCTAKRRQPALKPGTQPRNRQLRLAFALACAGAALMDCKAWSFGSAGVQDQSKSALGFPRNVRDLTAATRIPGGVPGDQLQVRHLVRVMPGAKQRTHSRYCRAKETECGEIGGQESHRLIVPANQGNFRPWEPWGGKRATIDGTVGGKHDRCIGT